MLTAPPLVIDVSHQPSANTTTVTSKQIIHDTAGQTPTWVTYNPAVIAAVAHLHNPTPAARFMLGAAGYLYNQTLPTGELWAKPQRTTNP